MITRGKQKRPFFVMLYGQPGVGKTTFASAIPNAVFFDLERGTDFLDVARIQPLESISDTLGQLFEESESFDTLIIDSLTSLEKAHQVEVCAAQGWSTVEALDYGRSKKIWREKFIALIKSLEQFRESGKNIVLIAHSRVKEVVDAVHQQSYDRLEFDCDKELTASILASLDGCFLLKHKTVIKDDKALGNGSRVLLTQDKPQYIAKSRWDLPETINTPDSAFWEIIIKG
jgi:hypothetical protein